MHGVQYPQKCCAIRYDTPDIFLCLIICTNRGIHVLSNNCALRMIDSTTTL